MVFLIAIFLSFVIYGLVDSLFPSVWPQMAVDINLSVELIGVIVMIMSAGSGIASAFAYKVRRKLGTSRSIVSGFILFAIALVLFLTAKNIVMICIALAIMGFGNGIIDTVANSYVIKAYDSAKLSILHASWGLGSSIGPILMGFAITNTESYKNGFLWTIIILIIAIVVFLSLKIYWETKKKTLDKDFVALHSVSEEEKESKSNLLDIFKIENGVMFVTCFIIMGSVNTVLNSWMPTIAVGQRGMSVAEGATTATCFFVGLTATRLLFGLVANKISNQKVIYGGLIISLIGYAMLFVRNNNAYYMYATAVMMGIGISPLIPFMHSSVKEIFDEEYMGIVVSCCNSTSLVGGALVSAFATFFAKLVGINYVQILFIILITLGIILYSKIIRRRKV